ncbi:hypothetical protein Tco_0389350 [Tanacetum coccineum]
MNVVTRSNGQKRSFSTLIRVLSVFDREDLDAIYKLVMDIYQDRIPEGFDKVSLGRFDSDVSIQMNKMSFGTHNMKERISHSHANREEVSFEKGNSGANAKAKIGV